jgi:hypothetical protein
MIISKDSNNNWTPVATGNGTFVGTKTAFDAVKDDLPDNTVAYTTDDGESVTDEITDGDMRAVTSNAVYDALAPVDISSSVTVSPSVTIRADTLHVVKSGYTVNVSFIIDSISDTTSQYIDILTGLPTPRRAQELSSICFTNSNMYYDGYYFNGTLRMYERTSGFSRVQFTYIAA